MSIPVSLDELRRAIEATTSSPYLLSVGADGRPHCVSVSVEWRADALVTGVGNTTGANASARPLVSLVWPPSEPGGHSLIVDATATTAGGGDGRMILEPTRAVLHRTVATPDASAAGESDCRPVYRP